MTALKLADISKRFGKNVWAVKKINLEVEEREFVVLLGPSGCGKTTTLRMVAGLEEVTTGSIGLFDRDITEVAPRKRNISMVFQSYAVWPHMTVFENIAFALKLDKVQKSEIIKTVNEVAEMVKIGELLERYPKQLSGGQRQRVALARALAVHPQLFLMDEPLSNLDAKLRVVMRTELRAIHQKTGATTIFVTHDQSEAMSMADRIIVMQDGDVVQSGTPDDVYRRSASVFVAGFIGTPPTNFFHMDLIKENGSLSLRNELFSFPLEDEQRRTLENYDKSSLILGARPEDILIVTAGEGVISKDILVVEPQGSHKIVAIELGESIVKIVAPAELPVSSGDSVHLKFKQSALSFFDKDTELRIGAPGTPN